MRLSQLIVFVLAMMLTAVAWTAVSQAQPSSAGLLRAGALRCEYLVNPLGIGEANPRLTWLLESDRRGEVQTAYRVLVASTREQLARDEGDLWDSGKVASNQTAHVEYAGKSLAARQACHWKVMSWDRDDKPGAWSVAAVWEMGLLTPGDWQAQWIEADAKPAPVTIEKAEYFAINGSARRDVTREVTNMIERGEPIVATNEKLGGDPARDIVKRLAVAYKSAGASLTTEVAEGGTAVLARSRVPYLRKSFTVEKAIKRARIYSTALGVYELYLNGDRVGDDYFSPGWTDYRERVRYQVYDVTPALVKGKNALGAIVGPGWFSGRAGLFHIREFYGKTPAVIVQLEIEFEDGSTQRVISDGSWRRTDGPILAADMMDGEVHDAQAEIPAWCEAGLNDQSWEPVKTREESRHLESSVDEPVRILKELASISLTEPKPGRWTFDLGQNIVGVVRLRLQEPAGTVLTIKHGELINPDGTIYTANLRGAAATDTYICRGPSVAGGGLEEWQPRFTFHGFRYVEVTGLTQPPEASAVTGVVLGSAMDIRGEFECSDPSLNKLQANIVWGMTGNYLSIPTDCPQRDERMGWMADTQVFAPTAAYNADIAPFMTKWMMDVEDSQREDGAHADVAPFTRDLTFGTPAWADAGTIVPWVVYQMDGDRRMLERHIDSMKRWVDWCEQHSTHLIRDRDRGNDYGDWLSIDADTPKDLIGTAYFAHSAWIVAESLRVLGRDEEAAKYQDLFQRVRAAFLAKYVQPDGKVGNGTQSCYLLALRFGLLEADQRGQALEHLVKDLRDRGWRLTTGFVGVGLLLPTLDDAGRIDAAYRLLMQDAFPSWLFSVKHGATTIWERWDGWTPDRGAHPDISMNSFNHYSLGSCGEWLYSGVGGIRVDPAHPGFERFIIKPHVDGPLTWASTKFRSIRGEIETNWRVEGDYLTLRIVIPANTVAAVFVPGDASSDVLEGGRKLQDAQGIKLIGRQGEFTELQVGSGEYEFTTKLGKRTSHAGNPVIPGWYADPEVIAFDSTTWIFPTYSAPYDQQTFFDAFSSTDLTRWQKYPRVLEAKSVPWAKRAMWAPSVVRKDGQYYFFFAANDIQNDQESGGIGVAVSDAPSGPYVDHIGKPLIDKFHNGAQPIDQFVLRDGTGQWWIIYGGWKHCNIARLADDFKSLKPFDDGTMFKEITPEGYVEGPFMFERGGHWYFMWSEGGWTGPDYCVAYAMSDSPLGPWKRIGKILQQDPAIGTGAGHHSILHVPASAGLGDEAYRIVYHRRPLGEKNGNHRVVCIDPMEFNADGTIKPVKMTAE